MKKSVAIFGGGPASLALASFLDPDLFQVTIYEQNKTCGRKFLVAGKGGFNLTHSEPLEQLIERYIPSTFLKEALLHFSNSDFRQWLAEIGIETFVGSSGRVFPIKGIKPIEVLGAILKHLESREVDFQYESHWEGWNEYGQPLLNGRPIQGVDYCVYAFGGSSWKVTGSTGKWTSHFESQNIEVKPFLPSNCAFEVDWPAELLQKVEGKPLKNIALRCGGGTQKGEAVITQFGLEGNAIYALSPEIRSQLNDQGLAKVSLDFKPMFSIEQLKGKLEKSKSRNSTEFLKKDVNLNPTQVQVIKGMTTKEDFLDREKLLGFIKGLEVKVIGTAPIDEAISTVGGICRSEVDAYFELKQKQGSFCIGEMVDWDAPTGGYLLQGSFSMGVYLADYLNGRGQQ